MKHTVVDLDLAAIGGELSAAILALGQPTFDGINSFFVSRAAASAGLKVALSGVGGDELFGGYASFRSLPLLERADRPLSPFRRCRLGRLLGAPGGRSKSDPLEKLRWVLAYGGSDAGRYLLARGVFAPHETAQLTRCGVEDVLRVMDERIATMPEGQSISDRVTALEAGQYLRHQLLRDTDAASMAASLEVRTPLVDHRLYDALAALSGEHRTSGPAKRLLRQAGGEMLPDEIWQRRKTGFSLPFERWLRSGAVNLQRPRHPLLDAAAVDGVFDAFDDGMLHWSRPWSLHVLAHHL